MGMRDKITRALGWTILLAAAPVALAACGSSSSGGSSTGASAASTPAATTTAATASAKPVRVAFFAFASANTLAAAEYKGIQDTAAKMNASVKEFDGKGNPQTQVNQLQTAATSGQFDAFVIFPVNGVADAPIVKQAIGKGIKVVATFSTIGKDANSLAPQVPGLSATVATGIDDSGKGIGELTAAACKGSSPCNVAYMPGLSSFFPEVLRLAAFKKEIGRTSSIKLVAVQQGQYAAQPAAAAAQNILQAHPDLNVIATSGDQMTVGAAQAVAAAGKSGKVKLIGDGASKPAVAAIRSGKWFGSYVLLPQTEGRLAAKYAIQAARGQSVPASTRSIALSPIGRLATKQTLGSFAGEWDG
jgi:ribose transport system substrate-binding protein